MTILKKALISAIGAYPPPNTLYGPPNDLLDWKTTLEGKGFSTATLSDSWSTKNNNLNNLQSMVNEAYSEDKLVYVFSGHGSYASDLNGDESDGRDEGICPIDVFQGGFIIDDELKSILSGLRQGVVFDIFLDSCYSGTGTRVAIDPKSTIFTNLRPKYIPGPMKVKKIAPLSKAFVNVNLNHCLWTAAKSNQLSWEGSVNGVTRSAFSYYACKCIRENPTKTRAQLITLIQSKLGTLQTPQLECTATKANQLPFM